MFILKRVHLKGWCQHADREFELGSGTNGVIGPNGVGKSNMLGGILMGLTGQALVGTLQENINDDMDQAVIDLDFEIDGTPGSITRTVKAPRDDAGLRPDKASSSASLTFGNDPRVRGANKVTARLEELAGYSAKAIFDHVFVSQNKLTQLLFQQNAKRLSSFMALIPAVDRAEPLRSSLHNELSLYPEVELGFSLQELQARVKELEAEIEQIDASDRDISARLTGIDIAAVKDVLKRAEATQDIDEAMRQLQERQSQQQTTIDQLTVEQATHDTQLATATKYLEDNANGYKTAQATLAQLDQARAVYESRQKAEAELAACQSQLSALVEPVVDPEYDEAHLQQLIKGYEDAQPQIASLEKLVQLLQSGQTQCPTCGHVTEDPQATLQAATQQLSTSKPPMLVVKQGIDNLRAMKASYESSLSEYQLTKQTTEARLQAIQQSLSELPQVPAPDSNQQAQLSQVVTAYESTQETAKSEESQCTQIVASIKQAADTLEFYTQQLSDQQALKAQAPTPQAAADAQATEAEYARLQRDQATQRGTLAAKRVELDRTAANLADCQRAADRSDAVTKYRDVLEGARTILHRDNLPTEMMSSYLGSFEDKTNKFLNMFGNPFVVEIARDMEITCIMPSGARQRSERLSGGQQAVLSVAARFAIHELFVGQLGLMILDEPSQNLDVDNVQWLSKLLAQVGHVSKTTGAQTIIVTHHVDEMESAFDNTINLSPAA
jgi:DNA repair exonuclease SbcCD ATPase subunit